VRNSSSGAGGAASGEVLIELRVLLQESVHIGAGGAELQPRLGAGFECVAHQLCGQPATAPLGGDLGVGEGANGAFGGVVGPGLTVDVVDETDDGARVGEGEAFGCGILGDGEGLSRALDVHGHSSRMSARALPRFRPGGTVCESVSDSRHYSSAVAKPTNLMGSPHRRPRFGPPRAVEPPPIPVRTYMKESIPCPHPPRPPRLLLSLGSLRPPRSSRTGCTSTRQDTRSRGSWPPTSPTTSRWWTRPTAERARSRGGRPRRTSSAVSVSMRRWRGTCSPRRTP